MSRFGNLELDGRFDERSQETGATSKDEAYYVAQANAALEGAHWEQALRHFGKVLEFNPRNTGAWCGQVRMLVELGELKEAKVWADKALEKFPDDAELMAAKAVALGRMGDLEAALAFSDASIQERGETPYVWLARGDVLLARKETRADYCFQKANMLAGGAWLISWLAGRIRMFYLQFSLALKQFQQALELNPTQPALWYDLGCCQRELGFAGPARRSLDQAIELDPHSHAARLALTQLNSSSVGSTLKGWWNRLCGR